MTLLHASGMEYPGRHIRRKHFERKNIKMTISRNEQVWKAMEKQRDWLRIMKKSEGRSSDNL